MIWGAISYNWKSPLVFLVGPPKPKKTRKTKAGPSSTAPQDDSITSTEVNTSSNIASKHYGEQVLTPIVGPAFHGQFGYSGYLDGGLYVEDQAPIHGTRIALVELKQQLGIPLHKRPASSPDLNPIENLWRTMKSRIKAYPVFPGTLATLKAAIQAEWDRLEPNDWNKLIDSMPDRIMELKQKRGLSTSYWIYLL